MIEHPDRAAILGELHARPFAQVAVPCRIYQFAFMTGPEEARTDRAAVSALAARHGVPAPAGDAKFHSLQIGDWSLRWESHTEFTTYTWSASADAEPPFKRADPFGTGEISFAPPGRLIAAVHVAVAGSAEGEPRLGEGTHRSMLCVVDASEGGARLTTDFQADAHGFTRYLVEARVLSPTRVGRVVQRVLELETYRVLALLGLPEARRLSPELARMEAELNTIAQAMGAASTMQDNHGLLQRLTSLAAGIEAQTAASAFRFGATRAYHGLVKSRIEAIGEARVGEHVTLSAFLRRRFDPAMETCQTIEARQARLSSQLARTADLLRTRIQFELEQQNRDLLQSMNRRAQLQLRLQETVEGLSIAAITYYVVGLVGYIAKGAKEAGLAPKWATPELVAGASVPIVMVGIWLVLQSARAAWTKRRAEGEHEP